MMMTIGIRMLLLAVVMSWISGAGLRAQQSPVINRTYRIGSDFLHGAGAGGNLTGAGDPFSAEEPESTEPVKDIQQTLSEELGIDFPEGTWVRYDPRTGRLEIQHHAGAVAAIEAYFTALDPGEKSISIRAEIYQVPAAVALRLLQFCGPLDDHDAAWKSVLKLVESGEASLVTVAPVLARSGQRARVSQVDEVIYPTEIDFYSDDETTVPAAFETRDVGTDLEVDPVLGPDDFTIDLNFSFQHHSAPPTMRPIPVASAKTGRKVVVEFPEFHAKKIVTQLTMVDGCIKLIGAWRPTGKPEFEKADVMQIAFLKADVVTKETVVPVTGDPESK